MRRAHVLEELIFWHIYDRQHCLRRDLRERSGLSEATISRAVTVLLEKELVAEAAPGASRKGRKPQVLQVNPRLANLLGLEIDLDRVTAAVTDMSGALLGRGAVRFDARQGLDRALEASQEAVGRALADAGVSPDQIRHLGVGHPGDLDLDRGVCVSWANAPAWRGVPIRERLRRTFPMDVTIDDHSRALALAERRTSPEDGRHPNAIYLLAGTGIGIGIFIDGRLYRGATRGGGEIGHTLIDPGGPLCQCGNRGCVEAFASIGAVLRYVRESLAGVSSSRIRGLLAGDSAEITIEMVAAAARRGDRIAHVALERAATALGLGVANVVQVLNPSLVVVCGRLARFAGEPLVQTIAKVVRQRCVETAVRRLEFRLSPPKKDISAVGCALLAAEAEAQRIVRSRLFGEGQAPA
jgi:predicted NBD/HSP70 family sugar kinase